MRSSISKKCLNGEAEFAEFDFEQGNQVFEAYYVFGYLQFMNSEAGFLEFGGDFEADSNTSNAFIAFFDNNSELDVSIEEECTWC